MPAPASPDQPNTRQPNTEQPADADRPQRGLSPAESLALAGALGVCVAARLADRLAHAVGARGWIAALVVAVATVSIARTFARAPFTLDRSSHGGAGLRHWATGEAGILGATFAAGTAVAIPLYLILRATPWWWLVAWVGAAALTLAWQLAMPALLHARAGSPGPVPGPLDLRLRALARRAGVDLPGGVEVAAKGRHRCANAYVLGLGPARRVVLEQAVAAWPPELVDQAVAHELGHVRLGHVGRRLPLALLAQLTTLTAAAAALSFAPLLHLAGVRTVGDPASYPLLLAVGAVVVLPARCLLAWHARAQERAADRFARALLDRPGDFTAMLRRAGADSGAPRQLPWWRRATATHPPLDERAAACRTLLPTGSRPPGA